MMIYQTNFSSYLIPHPPLFVAGMGDLKPVISMLHNPVETAEELDLLTKKAARSVLTLLHR